MAENHDRYCIPLKYGTDIDAIFMITDGCATGISGVVSQGTNRKNAKVAVFYSAKLNSTQKNYAVHEIGVRWCRDDVTTPRHPEGKFIFDNGS